MNHPIVLIRKKTSIFLAVLLLLGWIVSDNPKNFLSSSTLYVSPIGNDSNAGTIDFPLRTIPKALGIISDGGTIVVRVGTYPEVKVTRSSISLQAYSHEVPIINGGIYLENVSRVLISGFEVINADGNGIYRLGGIFILQGSNNTIQNCIVHHNILNETNGIKIQDSSYNHILSNVIYDNGGVGIRIIGSSSPSNYNEIGGNTVYGNVLDGWDADGIGILSSVSHTYIHDNNVYGNGDDGIDVWDTHYNLLVNNVSHDNKLGDGNGFKLGWGGDNTVQNNIAYGNRYRGFSSNGGGGNYYLSNTSYNNGWCGFEDNWRVSGDTRISTFENNQSYDNGIDFCLGDYSIVITTTTPTLVTPILTVIPTISPTPCRRPKKRC